VAVGVRDAITGSPGPTLSLSPRLDGSWNLRVAGIGGGRYRVEQLTQLGVTWEAVLGCPRWSHKGSTPRPICHCPPNQPLRDSFGWSGSDRSGRFGWMHRYEGWVRWCE